jgi:Bacterial mobilisation protein (MobC)
MVGSPCIQCRVSPATKAKLTSLARQHQLSDSALLKRLVEIALLQTAGITETRAPEPIEPVARGARLYVRLRQDDDVLLRERAAGRGMAAATYASMVLRSHLRSVTPLPDRELLELKRAIGALGVIGRNLNQIARVANQTTHLGGPSTADLRELLRALVALREHTKALIQANATSWETGHAETNR